ncbi:hypothetical protein BX286_6699 [Streptomyces sp. 3211.6]|uniref:hypothetical protein n=1 Tax=Streptomyces TaxID=1883 RepID=UPI0009A5334B|nr:MULTISPECIES: hypothetical protein [Streptomyces]RKT08594.1 hypothetical protein BX286_6699 [Streptomyces sp. 3211.6]RPF29991.1 hypothetical protein EDD96_6541 [Streptomyces sp. Ag109_G2-6]
MKGRLAFAALAAAVVAVLPPAAAGPAQAVPVQPGGDCAALISLISDPNVSVQEKKQAARDYLSTHSRDEINECRSSYRGDIPQ